MSTFFKHTHQIVQDPSNVPYKAGLFFQGKLQSSNVDPVYGIEADAISKKVIETPQGSANSVVVIQRTVTDTGANDGSFRAAARQTHGDVVAQALSSPGSPLDNESKSFMENRFAHDFSNVRIHTGAVAAKSADALNAKAYTSGSSIIFNKGMYDPQSIQGRKLLAHELTHVVQQKGYGNSKLVQRSPIDIHGPVLDTFSDETGIPRHEASPHSPAYQQWMQYRSSPQYGIDILNSRAHTDSEYVRVVTNAADNTPLWSLLTSRQARINFIRFLIARDSTNCRPYQLPHTPSSSCVEVERNQEVFTNLCMGFATQFYVRYNNATARLSGEENTRLENVGHIYAGAMLPKFRVPVFMAMYPGHAFNAFLLDANASDISSYLFLEPQNDNLFTSSDPLFKSYFDQGMITINRLTGFNAQGQYQTSDEHTFAERGGVPVHAVLDPTARIALTNLSAALRVANNADTWRYTIANPGLTFEGHFQTMASSYGNAQLAAIFPFLDGRTFKRSPTSPSETLNRATYIQLTGRTALQTIIP